MRGMDVGIGVDTPAFSGTMITGDNATLPFSGTTIIGDNEIATTTATINTAVSECCIPIVTFIEIVTCGTAI